MVGVLNICKSFFIFSFFFSSVSFSELRSEEFFGYRTYEPITNYFPNKILSKKFDHPETLGGFYMVDFTNFLNRNQKSPYFDKYLFSIDNKNSIHMVVLSREYKTMEICQTISNDLVYKINQKYNITFQNADATYPQFKAYRRQAYTKDNHRISINCNYYFDDDLIEMYSFIATPEIDKAVTQYYQKGF